METNAAAPIAVYRNQIDGPNITNGNTGNERLTRKFADQFAAVEFSRGQRRLARGWERSLKSSAIRPAPTRRRSRLIEPDESKGIRGNPIGVDADRHRISCTNFLGALQTEYAEEIPTEDPGGPAHEAAVRRSISGASPMPQVLATCQARQYLWPER